MASFALDRRSWLKAASAAGIGWMTPLAQHLARAAEDLGTYQSPQSVIFLWLGGGPSQLETFDPHPGKAISGETTAIKTAVPGIQLASGLPRTAEVMESLSLVRNLVSKEGDHERGMYLMKTGYSPIPTGVHPSLGAILCHHMPENPCEIPRHISILSGGDAARGGFLGDQYDAFKLFDPRDPVPDVSANVDQERLKQRQKDLDVIESAFARRRSRRAADTLHRHTMQSALTLMSSEQLKAFDIMEEPEELRERYGDSPFGRGCLAARRLIQRDVRCVEVALNGWDTHANNYNGCVTQNEMLDPALATLIEDLQAHELFERTIVLVGGEFGRTPTINGLAGRDHWPSGFSYALGGGGLKGGLVIGETDPAGNPLELSQGTPVANIHATVLTALGLDITYENIAPGPRPIKICEGTPIAELMPG